MPKRETSTKTNSTPATFEAQLASLEKIVRELERGDLPLERSLELFERGVKLSRECQDRLNEAERRIEVLLRDDTGRPVVAGAFDAEDFTRGVGGETEEAGDDDESVF